MKIKYSIWCLGSALLLGAVSCKEKSKTTDTKDVDKSVVEKAVDKVKEVIPPTPKATLSNEERAAKLGFAKYLPADTEMAMSVYNAQQAADDFQALELYKYFVKMQASSFLEMEEGALPEPDEEILEEEKIEEEDAVAPDAEVGEDDLAPEEEEEVVAAPSPWTLLGREVTIAMGKSGGEQTGHLLTVSRRMGYFQAKAFGKAVQVYAKKGDMAEFSEFMDAEMEEKMAKNLLEDPESGTALWEKVQMPAFYMAFRAKEGELEQAAQLVKGGMGMFAMAGEMVAPIEFESGGGKFTGFKVLGEEIAKLMGSEREEMDEAIGAKNADSFIASMKKKNLVVATGTIGEYVVVLIGESEKSLKLVDKVSDSLVASGGLNFADPFAEKKMVSLFYGEKELLDTIADAAGGISSYALGFRDGISGGGGLGDTRDLASMLQIIADREKDLLAMTQSSDLGMIAYMDQGLRIESFGGSDSGAIDWGAKTKLSHLGDSGDNMMFLSVPSNAAYDKKMGDYAEAIVETMYAATVKFAALDIEAPELEEMRQYTKMFDTQFRGDLVGLYSALSGSLSDGLGNEMALVVDLKGSMPAIPGIPQKVVDQAKAPRLTMLAPVKDRAKLKKSWDEVNKHTSALLAVVSEMSGEKIPMQKPISSEKDGMTTWFLSFPFFQDDFLPSVTVSDDWFAASTSKTQATDLMSKAKAGGETGEGVEFYVNFNAITSYAEEMLKVVDKNAAEIFPEESAVADFQKDKEEMNGLIEACREFESMKWIARKNNGILHHSIHFQTK